MNGWKKVLALVLALALAPIAARAQSVVNEQWWATYPMGYDASASRMGIDAAGNVFLLTGDGLNVSMVKIAADGTPGWRHDTPIPGGIYMQLIGAGVDPRGVPYFAVTFWGGVGQLVVRLDAATGEVLTSTVVPPPAGYQSLRGWDVKADAEGNLFTGNEGRFAGSGSDGFVAAKIDTAGAVAWYAQWRPSYYSWSPRLGVDSQGNLVLHGDAWYGFSTGWDPVGATIKFDGQTGATLWQAPLHYGLPNRGRQGVHLYGVGFDTADGIYLAGAQASADSGANYLGMWPTIVKYDADGVFQWESVEQTWKGSWFRSLVTDSSGAAYVTAGFDGSSDGSGADCVVARYLPDGTRSWLVRHDGSESGDDSGCLLAAGGDGLYLAFTSTFVGRGPDATVLKLDPASGAVLWRVFSGSALVSRPAFGPGLLAANASGTVAVHGKAGPDLGVLQLGPEPTPATLVAPTAVSRLAASGLGSAVVGVTVSATQPEVACNFSGGGTPFNALHVKAGAAGTFLYRPQVAPTGYQATCYYDGPAGVGPVTATLNLRFEDPRLSATAVTVAFDGTATHQAATVSLDAALATMKASATARLWVFDGVDSVDPDSGPIAAYRWEVRSLSGAVVATLSGRGVTYRFPSAAAYDVRLVVTDDDGATGEVVTRVTP